MWDLTLEEYTTVRDRLDAELTGRKFPEKVVSERYQYFYLVDFDNIDGKPPFLNALTDYLKGVAGNEFVLLVTDPEPEFYYKTWGKIPALRITSTMTYKEYLGALDMDPGNSPAGPNALNTSAFEFFIFPPDLSMIFHFSRAAEFGVGCFERKEAYDFFARYVGHNFIDSVKPDVWHTLIPSVEAYRRNYLM